VILSRIIKETDDGERQFKRKIIIVPFDESFGIRGVPIIKCKIFNKDALLLFDTGANTNILNKLFFDKYAPSYMSSDIIMSISGIHNKSEEHKMYNIDIVLEDTLTQGNFAVGDFGLSYDELKFDGIVGSEMMDEYDMHIDVRQRIAWFEIIEYEK
jgi:hypothetical protein